MADLAKFQQETTAAYQPAYTSLQNQLGQLDKKLQSSYADIDKQYNSRLTDINSARNDAAYESSIAAAANGGGFGGRGDIAREKYYQRTFVPAMRAAASDKNSAYKAAQEARDNSYDSLNNQLAQLQAEANRYALQRYDAAVEAERQAAEAEKNRQAQLAASRAASSAWGYVGGGGGSQDKYGFNVSGSDYTFKNNNTGALVRMGTYINQYGGDFNGRAVQMLQQMKDSGDYYASVVLNQLNKLPSGTRLAWSGGGGKNTYAGSNTLEKALNTLGIKMVDPRGNTSILTKI